MYIYIIWIWIYIYIYIYLHLHANINYSLTAMNLGRSFCAKYVLPGIFPDGPANHSELISTRGVTLLVPDLLKADPPFFGRQNVARFSLASRSQGQGWSPKKRLTGQIYNCLEKRVAVNFHQLYPYHQYKMAHYVFQVQKKSRHFLGETTAFSTNLGSWYYFLIPLPLTEANQVNKTTVRQIVGVLFCPDFYDFCQ